MKPSDAFTANRAATIDLDVEAELLDYATSNGAARQRAFGVHFILQNAHVYRPTNDWGVAHHGGPESNTLRAVNECLATLRVKDQTPN